MAEEHDVDRSDAGATETDRTGTGEPESSMKQIWDGIVIEHPVLSIIGALLIVALAYGGTVNLVG